MGKRKNAEHGNDSEDEEIKVSSCSFHSGNSATYTPTQELVDVDFEFFDPAAIDYLAVKRLLNQLFSSDAPRFEVEKLTELILSQPLLGSTVKTDGIDSDPYALLSVINMNVHKASSLLNSVLVSCSTFWFSRITLLSRPLRLTYLRKYQRIRLLEPS